jgi:tetratricopeptide (TPR) repeat protein
MVARWAKALGGAPGDPELIERFASEAGGRGGELPELLAAWDKAAEGRAPSAPTAVFRARLEEMGGDAAKGREMLAEAARRFPEDVPARWYLGQALARAEDYRGASEALEKVLARGDPRYPAWTLRSLLVLSYARTGRSPAAAEQLRQLEAAGSVEALAPLAAQARLLDDAARLYGAALKANPAPALRQALARVLRDAGKVAEAETEYLALLETGASTEAARELFTMLPEEGCGPKIARGLLAIVRRPGSVRSGVEEFDKFAWTVPGERRSLVLPEWDRLVDLAGDPLPALIRGRMYREWGGAAERALEVIVAAEKKWPDSAFLLIDKADLLRRAGRYEEIAAVYERLAEVDPDGRLTGSPPSVHRKTALAWHVQSKEPRGALRVGLLILADGRAPDEVRAETRKVLAAVIADLGGGFWGRLGELALPAPEARAAEAIAAEVKRLSDDDFQVRLAARRALKQAGLPALGELLRLADSPDADLRMHARELITSILTE